MFIGFLLVNTFFAMVTAWLIYYFLKSNFSIKISNLRLTYYIIIFGTLNGNVSSLWTEYVHTLHMLKPIILLVLSILLIKLFVKASWSIVVLSFCTISLIMGVANFLVPTLLKVTAKDTATNLSTFIFVNVIIYLLTILITVCTPFIKDMGKIQNLKPIVFLLILTFSIMAVNFCVHFVSKFNPITFVAVFISSLAYLISTFIYILKFRKYELQLEDQKQQTFYNESLSNTLHEFRRIKHDQSNHLSVISSMLKMGKSNEAYSYIQEIMSSSENLESTAIFNIKNAGLFGIISSKMDIAKKAGVDFKLSTLGIIDSIDDIKISDLCEIIGIFLDNAIESAQESDKKEVQVQTMSTENSINITIKNSCREHPLMHKIKVDGFSTKGNNRGHGLFIADKIIQQYKTVLNNINYDEENMEFTQMLRIEKGY